jgi:hypothetical protein
MVWQGRGMRNYLALMSACWMSAQVPYPVQAQLFSVPEAERRSIPGPDIQIIPSFRMAERYDSNVYFLPGTNLEDYITTFSPQIKVNHRSEWVEGTVGGGATGEVFSKNAGLNYVGGNGTVDLTFDNAMNRLVHGLKLRVGDSFIYTPQPLAFAAPIGGNQISAAFVPGIQAQRVNSFTNAAKVEASYFFSPFMGVTSTYTDQRIRFGDPITTPTGVTQGGFRDTNFQTLTSGIVIKPSPADTILLAHRYQKGTFSVPGQPDQSNNSNNSFFAQEAAIRWSRLLTPAFQATGEGGIAVLSRSGNVQPLGTVALEWNGPYTTVQVSYSRTIAPSFLFVSAPLLSQVVSGAVRRQITEPLSLSLSGSYAVNESVPDSSILRFESYYITPSISYLIGKTFTATLSYSHSQFEQTFESQPSLFDRNVVQLSLVAEWK